MTPGQIVQVNLYGGKTAQRRVVADKGRVVVICAEAEWQAAIRQNRTPEGLGFPRECIADESLRQEVKG